MLTGTVTIIYHRAVHIIMCAKVIWTVLGRCRLRLVTPTTLGTAALGDGRALALGCAPQRCRRDNGLPGLRALDPTGWKRVCNVVGADTAGHQCRRRSACTNPHINTYVWSVCNNCCQISVLTSTSVTNLQSLHKCCWQLCVSNALVALVLPSRSRCWGNTAGTGLSVRRYHE
jgi:hypothetical protein